MRRWNIVGMSLGVAKAGRPTLARGYGFRDRERKLPATPATVYGIASMTKSFTALAILRLEEHGLLRVNDPVVRYLPEFRTPNPRWTSRIHLEHFLNHTSGLPPLPSIYYTSARSLARDPPYDLRTARRVGVDPSHRPLDTYEDVMEFLATERYRLLGPPGRHFSYSNEAFGLLGAVVERVTGRSYESYLEEEILRPAGMRHATFDTGVMFRFPEVTTLYTPPPGRGGSKRIPSQEWWEDTSLRACGGLRTNIEDLFSYLEIYRTGGRVGRERIVSEASIQRMLRSTTFVRDGVYYGLGIALRPDYHGTLLAFHGGGLKGVSSEFAVLPKKGVAGAVLANVQEVPSATVLHAAVNRELGLPLATPFYDLPASVPARVPLRDYAGWFCSGEGIWAKIAARRDHLRLDFRGIEHTGRGIRLDAIGNDTFLVRTPGERGSMRFVRDDRHRIWAAFIGWRLLRRRSPSEVPRASRGRMVW